MQSDSRATERGSDQLGNADVSEHCFNLPLIEEDELLTVLRDADNDQLEPLVEFIREKGWPTSKLKRTANYTQYFPDHRRYAREIVAEIQRYGANDIARMFRRGKGVLYKEIVRDVGKCLGIKKRIEKPEDLENEIIKKVLSDAYAAMTPELQMELLRSFRIRNMAGVSAPLSLAAFQSLVHTAGFPAYQATVMVANGMAHHLLGHGLSFTTNWVMVKGVSVAAWPLLGMAFAGVFATLWLSGPAYRVTVPCVVQIALIRHQTQPQRQRRKLIAWAAGTLFGVILALLFQFSWGIGILVGIGLAFLFSPQLDKLIARLTSRLPELG